MLRAIVYDVRGRESPNFVTENAHHTGDTTPVSSQR